MSGAIFRWCLPAVQRRGAGLGNELIPWARSFLAAQVIGARSLPPAFGMNTRRYWRHFGTPRYDWIAHRALQSALPIIHFGEADYLRHGGGNVADAFRYFADTHHLHRRTAYVVVTEGMWGGYRHIAAARQFITATLYQSRFAPANLLRLAQRLDQQKLIVAMHIRLGDFSAAVSDHDAYRGKFNRALPLDWYRNIAYSIIDTLGDQVQFLIISDGSTEQLKTLTDGLPTVSTSDIADSDCSDLLALAEADLLVCSVSSFSSMAAFLSTAPYLWFEPNLQRHDGRAYSIWGHEPAQQCSDSATQQAIGKMAGEGAHVSGRGVPVAIDGVVPAELLHRLMTQKAHRLLDSDLVQYGVVPMNGAG